MPGPASGVAVSGDAKTKYEEVKKEKKHRYVIYHIKDEKVIEVESTGKRDATYKDFLEELSKFKSECRYCVFDFPVHVEVQGSPDTNSMSVDRLILMRWCPENAKIKQKMLYSSSYEALKRSLVGVYKYIQACEFEEASQAAIEDVFKSKK